MTTVETNFSLRALVRDVMTSSRLADPRDIADAVMLNLSPSDVESALRQSLPGFVRQVNSGRRAGTTITRPDGLVGVSSKVAGIRDYWQRALDDGVSGLGEWRLLRDCTRDDLLTAVAFREGQARSNAAKAKQYRILVDLLDEHGARTVGELPAETLMLTLGRAA